MIKRPLAIGIENYKEIINKPYYYVDKTLLIKELLDKGGKVNLFTRPRRFGKTLTLSMLKTYFEQETELDGTVIDNSHYFEGKKIWQTDEEYREHMGKYPVISLSLKSAKQPDFKMAYETLIEQIAREYKRHAYLLNIDDILEEDKAKYRAIMGRRAESGEYATALLFLSECLKSYHKENVIILLDEYDVPLENAYFEGFYEEMIKFIRSLFESALKTNDNLEFAVITGCLRISRESIFTGLNNLKIISILDENFAEYFGFTPKEVEKMLEFYGISERKEEARRWYDGYLFGDTEVYNPWSIINYVDDIISRNTIFPKPYWSNTSSNSIVRELVETADDTVKAEIENLIAGGSIEKPVHEDITYGEIYRSQDNLWNFLFLTGYLKAVSQRFVVDTIYLTLTIPNEEIRYIYRNTIREWFEQKQKGYDLKPFYEGIWTGNCEQVENFINDQLAGSISYYDSAENFYHGYLFGLLGGLGGCKISSNKEQGNGRPDLVIEPFTPKKPAIIIELKRARKFSQMEELCQQALRRIEEQDYASELLDEGYQKIYKYGFCFCKKSCMVVFAQMEKE
ncbi:MAG: AAA family ATPase [Eubacterium sp.]|nr:AAA family ATPase [Eubacterium sp.]